MSKLQALSVLSAIILSGAPSTSVLRAQETQPSQARSPQEDNAATATPGVANPLPSTKQSEGTAADNTVPGATETRAPVTPTPGTANPLPATRRAEGTAADRSPPGETPVRGTAASQAPEQATSRMAMMQGEAGAERRGSVLIGMQVKDAQGQTVGAVKDIVVDPATGQITHAIVGHRADGGAQALSAVPWRTTQGMMRANAIVIDQSKLNAAPHFNADEWPDLSQRRWSDAADKYWQRNSGTAR